jgi:hypothetical protein
MPLSLFLALPLYLSPSVLSLPLCFSLGLYITFCLSVSFSLPRGGKVSPRWLCKRLIDGLELDLRSPQLLTQWVRDESEVRAKGATSRL